MAKSGFRFTTKDLSFLRRQEKKTGKASAASLGVVGAKLLSMVKKEASYPAYSYEELAQRDHPYAKRRGTIGNTGSRPKFAVGKDQGRLVASMQGKLTNQYEFAMYYAHNDHTKRIVEGTRIMIGRDVIRETMLQKNVAKAFVKLLSNELRKRIK